MTEEPSSSDDASAPILREWTSDRVDVESSYSSSNNDDTIAHPSEEKETSAQESYVQMAKSILHGLEDCTDVESGDTKPSSQQQQMTNTILDVKSSNSNTIIAHHHHQQQGKETTANKSYVQMAKSLLHDLENFTDVESGDTMEKKNTHEKSLLPNHHCTNSDNNMLSGNVTEGIERTLTLESKEVCAIRTKAIDDFIQSSNNGSDKQQDTTTRSANKRMNVVEIPGGTELIHDKDELERRIEDYCENASISEMSELTFETFATAIKRVEENNSSNLGTELENCQQQQAQAYLQLSCYTAPAPAQESSLVVEENESSTPKKKTTMKQLLSKSLILQAPISKLKEFIQEKRKNSAYNVFDEDKGDDDDDDDEEKKLNRSTTADLNVTHESISSQSSEEFSATSSSSRSNNAADDNVYKNKNKNNKYKEMMKQKKMQSKQLWEKTVETVKKEKKYQIPLTVVAVFGVLASLVAIIFATMDGGSFDAFLGFEYRFHKLISQHSPSTSFHHRDTPAGLAFEWMLNSTTSSSNNNSTTNSTEDTIDISTMSDDRLLQRFALVTLWFSTNGDQWDHRGTWLSPDQHECSWDDPTDFSGKDVHCNNRGEVVAIDLDSDHLTGSLPLELGLLTKLTKLSAYRNELTGTLPSQLGQMTQLEEVLLYDNQLSGSIPSQFGSKLSSLFWLRLEENQLSGTIPSTFSGLVDISWLLLQNNQLTGTVPTQLASLPNLSWLALNSNPDLHGTFPSTSWKASDIFRVWLHDTQLEGKISDDLCAIPRTQIVVNPDLMECSCCDNDTNQ